MSFCDLNFLLYTAMLNTTGQSVEDLLGFRGGTLRVSIQPDSKYAYMAFGAAQDAVEFIQK